MASGPPGPPLPDHLDRRARGAAVEVLVREHLLRAGLRDVAANAGFRSGEIDLVMLDPAGPQRPVLVFVEVRYRRNERYGGGAASVDLRKRRKLALAAQLFLASHPRFADAPCRFDVIEADGDPASPRITWLRDAFRLDDC